MTDTTNWCRITGHPYSCKCEYVKPDPAWAARWRKSGKRFDEWNRSDRAYESERAAA